MYGRVNLVVFELVFFGILYVKIFLILLYFVLYFLIYFKWEEIFIKMCENILIILCCFLGFIKFW